ncbi:MAG: hypothetical protein ABIA47_01175 [bacterium]
MKSIGFWILGASAVALCVYGLYEFLTLLLSDSEVPLVIRIGITGFVAGIAIILAALIIERIKDKKSEKTYDVNNNRDGSRTRD